jgi:hypothetical protein
LRIKSGKRKLFCGGLRWLFAFSALPKFGSAGKRFRETRKKAKKIYIFNVFFSAFEGLYFYQLEVQRVLFVFLIGNTILFS